MSSVDSIQSITELPEIDDAPTIQIGSKEYSYLEILEWIENGELEDKLNAIYKDLPTEDKESFFTDLTESIQEASDKFYDLKKIYDGKAKEARDLDDDMMEIQWNEFEDACKDLSDFFERDVLDYFEEAYNEFSDQYIETSDDIAVGPELFDDGDEVEVIPTGGQVYDYYDKGIEKINYDYDLDGDIDYDDTVASVLADKEGMYETTQDIFFNVPEGYTLNIVGPTNGVVQYVFSNPATSKTVTFNVTLKEGVRYIIDSTFEAITDEQLASMDAQLQKQTFLGASIYSVWEKNNEPDLVAKLDYIPFYGDLVSQETFDSTTAYYDEGGTLSNSQIYDLYKEYLQDILSVYTGGEDGEDQSPAAMLDAMQKVLQQTATLDAADQRKLWTSLILGLAYSGEQSDFQRIFGCDLETGTGLISAIENLFLQDGTLTVNGASLCGVLELYSGSPGKYAASGLDFFGTMAYRDDMGDPMFDEFGDSQFVLDVYDQLNALISGSIPWAVDTGTSAQYVEDLNTSVEEDDLGFSLTMTADYLIAADAALDYYGGKDAADIRDGITQDNYVDQFTKGITTISAFPLGTPMEDVALALKNFIKSQPDNWRGDLAAGIIYALKMASPELLKALVAVEGFSSYFKFQIEEDTHDPAKEDKALNALKKARDELDGYRNGDIR